MKKYVRVGIPVLATSIVIVGLIVAWRNELFVSTRCNGQEDNTLYSSAADAIKNEDTKVLSSIVDTIKQQSKYEDDINCLLPIYYSHELKKDYYSADKTLSTIAVLTGNDARVVEAYKTISISSVEDLTSQNFDARTNRSDVDNASYF